MPIITTEHFKSGQLPTVKDGIPQVSENDYCRLSSYILNINDLMLVKVNKSVEDTEIFSYFTLFVYILWQAK